jgi:hypothetical protein
MNLNLLDGALCVSIRAKGCLSPMFYLHITGDQKMAVSPALGCAKPTTKQQHRQDAEPKTVVSA